MICTVKYMPIHLHNANPSLSHSISHMGVKYLRLCVPAQSPRRLGSIVDLENENLVKVILVFTVCTYCKYWPTWLYTNYTYTPHILHIYYTYTTHIQHIHSTYTTLYYTYTPHILHIHSTYTHIYYTYTTHTLHIYSTYTTHILQMTHEDYQSCQVDARSGQD